MSTKSFEELVQKHVAGDPAFAEALLREGIEALLGGEVEVGKTQYNLRTTTSRRAVGLVNTSWVARSRYSQMKASWPLAEFWRKERAKRLRCRGQKLRTISELGYCGMANGRKAFNK